MPRVQVLPYLTPRKDRIQAGPWKMRVEALDDDIQELLTYWDPGMPLRIRRQLAIDIHGVREDCKLSEDTVLRIVLIWQSSGTTLRGRGACVDVAYTTGRTVDLELEID